MKTGGKLSEEEEEEEVGGLNMLCWGGGAKSPPSFGYVRFGGYHSSPNYYRQTLLGGAVHVKLQIRILS